MGQFDGVFGADCTHPDHQRYSTVDDLVSCLHQAGTLGHGLRIVLTSRPCDDDAVNTGIDKKFKNLGKTAFVDRAVIMKGSNDGYIDSFKLHQRFS